MPQPDDNSELEDAIVEYVRQRGTSRLRGRFFDVGSDEGKREYAEWLANEIAELNLFIEHDYDPGE